MPVSELSYDLTGPVLIGARPANPLEYPASFYALSADGACTSTLIGPRVLLTAAHCVENGGSIRVVQRGAEWRGQCEQSPDWQKDESADWALCALDGEVSNVPFENVNKDVKVVSRARSIELTGFGCTRVGGGRPDGIYRVGTARIASLPTSDNYVVTEGRSALCFGDSGGPAFVYTDVGHRRRVQVAVNSQGNLKDMSWLSSTSTAAASTFFTAWSDKHLLRICGVHPGTPGCRR